MIDKPDIVKTLIEEERLGKLESRPQGTYEELEVPEELQEDTVDESVGFFSEDFENGEFDVELAQHGSLSEDNSTDEKELLFQSTSDLMLYLNKYGRISKINKAGIAFSGSSKDEIIGQFFWKIPGTLSKHNISKYLKVFKNTLKGRSTKNFLSELHDKSGKKHIMDFSTYPIKENNNVTSILVVAKDVTEQKETEDKYRLITEKTSDLITTSTFTLNPIFTYISPSHKKAIGYEAHDLIGKPCFKFIHPDDKRKLLSLLKKYLSAKAKKLLTGEAEVSEKVEVRFMDKSGNWRYMETTANLIGNEIVSVSRDVTDRRKAEESLMENEKKLSQIVNGNQIPTLVIDKDHIITHWNDALEHLTGLSAKEMIGTKKQWKAFYQKERPIFADLLLDAASCNELDVYYPGKYRKSHLIKDAYIAEDFFPDLGNNGKWLNFSATLLKDSNGANIESIETLLDITERKQAEYELKVSYDKLGIKVDELEIYKKATVDREFRIIEMKKEVNELLKKSGQKPKYTEILDLENEELQESKIV